MTMRGYLCAIMLALSLPAQAAPLTLACSGTSSTYYIGSKFGGDEIPASMGIIVDLDRGTLSGVDGWLVPITYTDVNRVMFSRTLETGVGSGSESISGRLDRISGDLIATKTGSEGRKIVVTTTFELKCRPAQRLF